MNRTDITLVVASLVIFLSAPFLPTTLYVYSFTNMLVPFLLLIAALYSMNFSRVGSITLFLAIASLFVEFRRRMLKRLPMEPTLQQQLAPAPVLLPNEVHPPALVPSGKVVGFKPEGDATNDFSAEDATINRKVVLNSSGSAGGAEKAQKFLIEAGLAPAM